MLREMKKNSAKDKINTCKISILSSVAGIVSDEKYHPGILKRKIHRKENLSTKNCLKMAVLNVNLSKAEGVNAYYLHYLTHFLQAHITKIAFGSIADLGD